ncbi:MAG: hypothetical protein AAB909_04930 [Patescibacteria group bacterium]
MRNDGVAFWFVILLIIAGLVWGTVIVRSWGNKYEGLACKIDAGPYCPGGYRCEEGKCEFVVDLTPLNKFFDEILKVPAAGGFD